MSGLSNLGRYKDIINLFAAFFKKCLDSETGSRGGVESAHAGLFTRAD